MSTNLTRRRILAGASAVTVAAWSAPGIAQSKVTLIYSDIVPENDSRSNILRRAFSALGADLEFKSHHGGTLFKQGTEAVAIQRGNLDMANIASGDVQNQVPQLSLLMVPYLIRDVAHLRKLWASDVGAELNKLLDEKMGLRILSNPYIGTRHLGLRTAKKVMKPADLAGVKLRMPGTEAWLFLGKALGANPLPLAFTEVYTALQTGAIDGQDNPLPTNRDSKFFEVTKQIVLTSHLVDQNYVAFSKKVWDGLKPDQQKIVQKAADDAAELGRQRQLKLEGELEAFFKEKGLKVYAPDVAAFRAKVQKDYLESKFAKDWPAGLVDKINAVK